MKEKILTSNDIAILLEHLASQLIAVNSEKGNLVLMGIQRRGVDIANRLAIILNEKTGQKIPCGSIDITLYRDDWTRLADRSPHIGKTSVPVKLDGKTVILVDDVLFSGRTIRSALEALLDYGRPDAIRLLVLIDRGHRELPIQADYAGQALSTEHNWRVDVLTREHDGEDCVYLEKGDAQF